MAIVAQTSKYGQTGRTILAWVVGLIFFFISFVLRGVKEVFDDFNCGR